MSLGREKTLHNFILNGNSVWDLDKKFTYRSLRYTCLNDP